MLAVAQPGPPAAGPPVRHLTVRRIEGQLHALAQPGCLSDPNAARPLDDVVRPDADGRTAERDPWHMERTGSVVEMSRCAGFGEGFARCMNACPEELLGSGAARRLPPSPGSTSIPDYLCARFLG